MIYNVKLEQSNVHLSDEEKAIIEQFKAAAINVTQLCEELGKYGLQVVRISDSYVRLQMDINNGRTEAIISFEVGYE